MAPPSDTSCRITPTTCSSLTCLSTLQHSSDSYSEGKQQENHYHLSTTDSVGILIYPGTAIIFTSIRSHQEAIFCDP
ncbi:hypothetical protein AMECASPLE_010248 [Ameca splendens]|uniref:Uncharacterized protein n=1 Tax=Ameca splendens TaxID=208324 RepID=A0ABV0XDG5_9TELE